MASGSFTFRVKYYLEFQDGKPRLLHPWAGEFIEEETRPEQKTEAYI